MNNKRKEDGMSIENSMLLKLYITILNPTD